MDRAELEALDRESLVLRAQAAGIKRARILTRPELVDELLRLDPKVDPDKLRRSRGFFGVARDLLSRVVERGLHLPDAADRLRAALGTPPFPEPKRPEPQAVPTVTLAEIYAAQGHKARAIETLKRVLDREPEHVAARALLDKLEDRSYVAPPPPLPPEPEIEADAEAPRDTDPDPDGTRLTIAVPLLDPDDTGRATPFLGNKRVVDECIALPVDDGRVFVWFRVAAREDVPFVVRALVVTPSWDGPTTETRDLVCDPDVSEIVIRDLPKDRVVRVAIGWGAGAAFVPVAHSPLFERGRDASLVTWTLEGIVPVVLDDPRSASIAEAERRARSSE